MAGQYLVFYLNFEIESWERLIRLIILFIIFNYLYNKLQICQHYFTCKLYNIPAFTLRYTMLRPGATKVILQSK